MQTAWVERAARNNAEWCAAVCTAHGLQSAFHERVWACAVRTPPFYPDAVTLTPDASPDELLSRIDTAAPECSVKDSFATLDLGPAGFRVLFDATWIVHRSTSEPVDVGAGWSERDSPYGLDRPDVVSAGDGDSGAVFNVSDSVVGVSNLVTEVDDFDRAWSSCLAYAVDRFPGVPLVGYERDEALTSALAHGFVAIGQLRVWVDDSVQ
jgi:hypothetical protein